MTTATQTPTGTAAEGHIDPAAQVAAASDAFVPVQTRSERPTSFDPAVFGAPTGREINWKHTPLDRLRPLLVDEPAPHGVIDVAVTAPEGVEQRRLAVGDAPRGEVFRPEDVTAAIAWSQEAEAPLIRIPAGVELTEPVVVRLTGTGGVAHAHVVIEAQAHARGTVVLRHEGTAQQAQNVEIIARDGSALTVISLQRWDDDAIHAASHQGLISSAHDLSGGGLAQALADGVMRFGVGARVWLREIMERDGVDAATALFSETTARVIVTVPREEDVKFRGLCEGRGYPVLRIGVTDAAADGDEPALEVQDVFRIPATQLRSHSGGTMPAAFGPIVQEVRA